MCSTISSSVASFGTVFQNARRFIFGPLRCKHGFPYTMSHRFAIHTVFSRNLLQQVHHLCILHKFCHPFLAQAHKGPPFKIWNLLSHPQAFCRICKHIIASTPRRIKQNRSRLFDRFGRRFPYSAKTRCISPEYAPDCYNIVIFRPIPRAGSVEENDFQRHPAVVSAHILPKKNAPPPSRRQSVPSLFCFRTGLHAVALVSACGAGQLAGIRRMIREKGFPISRLKHLVALRADIHHVF